MVEPYPPPLKILTSYYITYCYLVEIEVGNVEEAEHTELGDEADFLFFKAHSKED
jgi:hypothetical protein